MKMEWIYFSTYLLLSTTKNTGIFEKKNKKTLKDIEKKDWLGKLGYKEWHVVAFPRFYFCLIYPRYEDKGASNSEIRIDAESNRILLTLAKASGKGNLSR